MSQSDVLSYREIKILCRTTYLFHIHDDISNTSELGDFVIIPYHHRTAVRRQPAKIINNLEARQKRGMCVCSGKMRV